jgi:hypothetical protein
MERKVIPRLKTPGATVVKEQSIWRMIRAEYRRQRAENPVCIACGDIGISTTGRPCIPCMDRLRKEVCDENQST